jgi:hypothetical protein
MKTACLPACAWMLLSLAVASHAAEPALTIYNQNFAVVRERIKLDLKRGVNPVRFADTTVHLEPDTVVLRDPAGRRQFRILEQNFRADPVSQELLLSLYEGQTIEFEVRRGEAVERVSGRIIRSGYVPHYSAMSRYGPQYSVTQMAAARGGTGQPVIEVDGRLQFSLPGLPLFPALPEESLLKPALNWLIETDQAGPLDAELAYLSGGMRWEAAYNAVAGEKGDRLDLVGWVTVDNQSGRTFEQARIKLMAGDVSRARADEALVFARAAAISGAGVLSPPVTERTFDEYHLYSLARATTLRDRETKQVEFIRAHGVESQTIYVYDGARLEGSRWRGHDPESLRRQPEYGADSNPKVWVMRELANSAANNLGIPLPRGKVRFYRQAEDGQIEFTGENTIDHTPKDERLRIYTGNAFDLAGDRRRTAFKIASSDRQADESFEIRLRNRKTAPVEIRVVERLYRWHNWEVTQHSNAFLQSDSRTIEFRISLGPDEEKVVSYSVRYTW